MNDGRKEREVDIPPELAHGIAPDRESYGNVDWSPGDPDPNTERVKEICEQNGWPMGIEIPEPPDTIG